MQADKDKSWKLYVMDLKKKDAECLFFDSVTLIATRPNWSCDDHIAFSAVDPSKPNNSAIYSINYKSKEIVAITDPSGFLDTYPQWSKDNAWLSFIRLDTLLPDFNLWKITTGQKELQLTNNEFYEGKSTISPDGKQIEMHPEWTRDGTKIVFDARNESDEGLIQYIEVGDYLKIIEFSYI